MGGLALPHAGAGVSPHRRQTRVTIVERYLAASDGSERGARLPADDEGLMQKQNNSSTNFTFNLQLRD
jgi:hypothetical protein